MWYLARLLISTFACCMWPSIPTPYLTLLSPPQVSTESGCFAGHPALTDLAIIHKTLQIPQPTSPDPGPIFTSITDKLDGLCAKRSLTAAHLSEPVLKHSITPDRIEKVEELCGRLNMEYGIRFKMLLKRLDLTMTSFQWGKKGKVRCVSVLGVCDTWYPEQYISHSPDFVPIFNRPNQVNNQSELAI